MTDTFAFEFADLEIGHGRTRIAGPLSARWHAGCVWVLTGPNGAGKTTLMRTLLGLLPPIAGRVDGYQDRRISYVPQVGGLDSGFPVTCAEVVETGLPIRTKRKERLTRARDTLAAVGLSDLAAKSFHALSGGQRQRVLVARALCADAEIVALDEPTAGVDAAASTTVWESVRSLADDGRLVVLVTHDVFRAPDYADHVLVLDDGQLSERREPIA